MTEQYAQYGLATDVFLLLSQGEEGDQGPSGEVGAQGPPVKYFLLKCYSFSSKLYIFFSYYCETTDIIKPPCTFLFILPYCL